MDALSKVLQPLIRSAQLLREANSVRQQCEILKRSFPGAAAEEAVARTNDMVERYGKLMTDSQEQFKLAESENEARCFRFPDKIARLVSVAISSLSEMGQHVNDGKFDQAELQFAKFADDFRAVKRTGRGLRLAVPFEWFWKFFQRKEPAQRGGKHDLTEKEMAGVMDLLYKRATTQAHNSYAIHPPQKLLDHPELLTAEDIIDQLDKCVFVVVFQDGAFRMFTLTEFVVFIFLQIDLAIQMNQIERMMAAADLPPAEITTNLRFATDDLMRPEMVKLLLSKVTFSTVSSDAVSPLARSPERKAPPGDRTPAKTEPLA